MGHDTLLCICQTCDCRHHKCEHEEIDQSPRKLDQDDSEVEFFERIVPVERVLPFIPEDNICIPDEPMERVSRYKSEFIPHILDNVHVKPPKRKYQPPLVPMENETEYRRIYYAKPVHRPIKYSKRDQPRPSEAFDGNTTYNVSYPSYDQDEMKYSRGKAFRKDITWPGIREFRDTTNYADTFKAHPGSHARHPIKPERQYLAGLPLGAKFYSETTHKTEYTRKIGKAGKLIKQPSNKNLFKSPSEVSIPISSMKRDYVNYYNVERMRPFVPNRHVVHSDTPMEMDTTYRHEYWHRKAEPPYPRPEWSKRKPYKKPSQELLKESTYKEEFKIPHVTQPTIPLKPKTSPFQFGKDDVEPKSTTYRTQFKQPPQGDYKGISFAPLKTHEAPVHPIQDITTTQDDYRGLQYPQSREQKPAQEVELQHRHKDKKMSGRTEYKETFGVIYQHLPPKTSPTRDAADKARALKANPLRCLDGQQEEKSTSSTSPTSGGGTEEAAAVSNDEKLSNAACENK